MAPPLSHIAEEYRAKLDTDAQVVTRMVEWALRPAPERSLLPSHAIEPFGLMPPQVLTERELRDVAAYILQLEPMGMRGEGMRMGPGRIADPGSHGMSDGSGMMMADSMMPHRREGPGAMRHEGMNGHPMTGRGGHRMPNSGAAPPAPPP